MVIDINKRLFLFWKVGKIVFIRQKCCENVVSKYSNYLTYYFGMSSTFSIGNVNYMKKFYCCFPNYIKEFDKLSFEHYKLLVDINDVDERYFYFRIAMFCRMGVYDLRKIINNKYYYYIKKDNN